MRILTVTALCVAISALGCGVSDPPDVSRSSAEMTLRHGGSLRIAGKTAEVKDLSGLPEDDFSIERIVLNDTNVTDDDLQQLQGLANLKYLGLYGANVTDAGLEHIVGLPSLEELELSYTQVTDAGLSKLKQIKTLKKLYLNGTNDTVTDAAVEQLEKDLPECRIFR